MLFGGEAITLILKHLQGFYDLHAGIRRVDYVVQKAATGGDVWRGELVLVFLDELLPLLV